jgi:hypothetical protein
MSGVWDKDEYLKRLRFENVDSYFKKIELVYIYIPFCYFTEGF